MGVIRIDARVAPTSTTWMARVQRLIRGAANDMEQEGAKWAERHIRRTYATHFKSRTPYYETLIHTTRDSGHWEVVDDGRVKYGPWLEGIGSRNAPVTRFRGYHAFRKAAQALDRRVVQMGNRLLHDHGWLRRMNGL